jgi:glycosyltransferase involved in cell wall biosynthesis
LSLHVSASARVDTPSKHVMRIVLLTTASVSGGVSRHLLDLASGLRDKGHEPCLAVPSNATRAVSEAGRRGLRAIAIRHAGREAADIWHMHLHDTYDRESLLVMLRRRPSGAATVITEHLPRSNASDPTLLPGPRRPGAAQLKTLFKRLQTARADRIIALSTGSLRFLQARYGLTEEQLRLVPNGISLLPDPPSPPPIGHGLRVVSVGALGMQKGHDVLIDAAGVAKEDWAVTIVGEGSARDRLERQAAAVSPGRVAFAGWQADIATALAASDCVCLPSRWESCPYAALEAMAAGRAIVGSAVDGLDELVDHGRTGLLVPPGDAPALAGALDELALSPGLCLQFGRSARARADEVGSLDRMVEGTVSVYRELIDG